jgi:NAD(P)-dependent dehydrogenase (short-subunit alcohol dehydrogenase family)
LHLTESLAAELAGSGVLAFAIAPGFLRTGA